MSQPGPSSRPYAGAKRSAKAAETRDRVLDATRAMLRDRSAASLSVETVAKAAGVTRLTVYNQFGSRRGLLEATFDRLAADGGMHHLATAMAMPDPRQSLDKLVQIFCSFWGSDECLVGLYAAAASDPELAIGLERRNARRRDALALLVRRSGSDASNQDDIVDLLFALTGFAMYETLARAGRSPDVVCRLLQPLCHLAMTAIVA